MKNHRSYRTPNPLQLFADAFILLLSRIETILYVSIPINLLKYLLFAIITWFLSSFQTATTGSFLVAMGFFVGVYCINSYVTLIYSLFLLEEGSSLPESLQKGKKLFRTILLSDMFFLGISLFVYIPFILISNLSFQDLPLETYSFFPSFLIPYVLLGIIWFLFVFAPYHSSIRLFLIHPEGSTFQVWKKGYRKYFQNFFWIVLYYFCFGVLYILISSRLSNYFLFEILMVVFIPFQSSIDVVSFKKIKALQEKKGSNVSRRNPGEGS
jgi:hypothetical protein